MYNVHCTVYSVQYLYIYMYISMYIYIYISIYLSERQCTVYIVHRTINIWTSGDLEGIVEGDKAMNKWKVIRL